MATVVLPLPAALSRTLDEDKRIEANYHKPQLPDGNEPPAPFGVIKTADALDPDKMFHLKHLNTQAMSSEIGTIVSKVDSGELAYQLFPKVNAVRFFKEIPRYITYNPVDIETTAQKHEQRNTSAEPNVFNCATLVGHLLKIGGMSIKESNTPWGLSPSELSAQLKRFG